MSVIALSVGRAKDHLRILALIESGGDRNFSMRNIRAMLERQSRWQRTRAALSWAEKLRLAEILREAAVAL